MKNLVRFIVLTLVLTACGDGRLSPQGGTITSVQGGSGLTGGGTGGAVTLNVGATAGGGLTVGADSIGLSTACTSGEVLQWDGDSWECEVAGITMSVGANIIPKSDGANLVASGLTDDGTTFDVNRQFTKLGSTDGSVHINGGTTGSINFMMATDADADGWINRFGFGTSGTTRFRNLIIGDGKATAACTVTGSTKTLNCVGGLQVNGTNVNTFTTSNAIPKGNGSGLVASSWTDDGTNTTTTANIIGTNAVFGSSTTTTAKVYSVVTGSGTGLRADNTSSGKTSDSYGVRSVQTGSFDSTADTRRNYSVSAQAAASRSAGSNDVINFGVYATASGGQANYSIYGDAGTVALNVSSGNTCIGATSCSEKLSITGTASVSSDLAVGGTATISTGAGTSPELFWKQSGQIDWKIYGVASSNNLNVWNSSTGTVATFGTTAITLNKDTTVSGTLDVTGAITENSARVFSIAGNGLTSSGATVNVACGSGLTCAADEVSLAAPVTQTESGTSLGTVTLGDNVNVLMLSGSNPTLDGMTGGVDGRRVTICHTQTSSSALQIVHEDTGETAANRFQNPFSQTMRVRDRSCVDAIYIGDAQRWQITEDGHFTNASTSSTFGVGSNLTVAGNTTLGNATNDTLTVSGPATFDVDISVGQNALIDGELLTSFINARNGTDIVISDDPSVLLTVAASSNFTGTLAVSGTDVSINSCGSGASVSGEAQSFQVTVGEGVATCTIDLNRTFNSAPYCTFSAANQTAAGYIATSTGPGAAPRISSTTTTVTLTFEQALGAGGGAAPIYNVSCLDRR